MKRVQDLLAEIGLEPERVRMVNLSSAMGGQFAAVAAEMSEQVRALGPSPLRPGRVVAEAASPAADRAAPNDRDRGEQP